MASLHDLCRSVKDIMPAEYDDSWYIVTETCLVACKRADELTGLYRYTVEGTSVEERNRINRRMRDILQKEWILTGIAPVLAGVTALANGEKAEGHENEGGLSSKWQAVQLTPEYYKRGTDFVDRLYAHNLRPTFENLWGSHLDDIRWQQEQIIYGLFLSDHSVLSAVETEMVSLCALMCGAYLPPKLWHLRGFRRLGPSLEATQKIYKAMQLVATWCGESVVDWPKPEDVEHEV